MKKNSKKYLYLELDMAEFKQLLHYKRKKKSDNIEIYIIDKNPFHTLLTELHEVAANRIDDKGVVVYLKDIFKYTDVNIIQDYITKIDFEKQELISEKDNYAYDYLIMNRQ